MRPGQTARLQAPVTDGRRSCGWGIRRAVPMALFLVLAALLPGAVRAAPGNIRVAIDEKARTVTIQSKSGLIVEGTGSVRTTLTLHAGDIGARTVRVRSASGPVLMNGTSYRGTVEVRKGRNGRLLVINELDLEDYLRGVVAAEVPSDWEMEALKAQAVAARTYAVYQMRNAGKRSYHILATVDSQMYLGSRGERPRTEQALRETHGQVVLYRGEVIPAFYHSSCGGHTEDALLLWGIDAPYLKGVDCDCQQISKYGLWEKRFSSTAVVGALRRQGYRLGNLAGIEIDGLTPAGRVRSVVIRHSSGSTTVPAETVRTALGPSRIPSIFFEPELLDGEVVFSGRGSGHGIGLCQWGIKDLARRGWGYRAILGHYYPGTAVGTL